jgi:1-acyl-sn-glycerol-3-phosphate acyltransferase
VTRSTDVSTWVDLLYRRSGAITVACKPARPRFLNIMRSLLTDAVAPMEQARAHLVAGRSVRVFPKGTVNRDPSRLLRGRHGAARLSLETGAPRRSGGPAIPRRAGWRRHPQWRPFAVEVGAPLRTEVGG